MSRYLVVAIGGAGGDLPPLIAAALELRSHGHEVTFIGDSSVGGVLAGAGLEVQVLPPAFDLGPRLAAAVRTAMERTGGDVSAGGAVVEQQLADWAKETSGPVAEAARRLRPDAIVTSLFGVEVVQDASPPCPWAVVNSTFYLGPHPPRPIEQDVGARAIPLLGRYAMLLQSADMVLHATDRIFDFSFERLPAHHHYAGPLGIWEPQTEAPSYLAEPGDPWVLVAISSQLQDDIPLADAALTALGERPVRVLLTVGPDHGAGEISARPANAYVEQVVPHSAVLRQGTLLVSHAGHGSVMKALWEGRPMVLMPWGRDQPGVAARAAALGVAKVVGRGENAAARLAAAIDEALGDEELRSTAAKHARRLQQTNPPEVAAALLESLTT